LFASIRRTGARSLAVPVHLAQRAGAKLNIGFLTPHKLQVPLPPPINLQVPAAQLARDRSQQERNLAAIQTSIIIPVFNKAAFTFQCLKSLLREIDCATTEIIVVDNASTDQTAQVLLHFKEFISVVRNDSNRGFSEACNQGAAIARGAYLVFLNNDTVVLPRWLYTLIETIESAGFIGAAGSMLLYPDGAIQEAGGIVWKNGHADHYGWRQSPDDRRFNFAREVDFCSAASLLIRRSLFEKLGGFDLRFAPAYYEDVDICFGIRTLGYKVIYQPLSRAIHFEGGTSGRDTTSGVKKFQVINRERFVEKWREVLQKNHLEKDPKKIAYASDRNRDCPRVVVFDERIPTPDRDAGSGRMFLILKTLAEWSHVIFVPFNRPSKVEYEHALWKQGIETSDVTKYRSLLHDERVRAVILSRPSVAEALIARIRRVKNGAKIAFDMVDIHHLRLEREYQITGDIHLVKDAERYRRLEKHLASAADVVWCASEADKSILEQALAGVRTAVVPTIHVLHDRGRPFIERRHLVFVGNFAHRPNVDGVRYFVDNVLERIQETLPDVELMVVGDNAPPDFAAYESIGVRTLGHLPSLEEVLTTCRVFVSPIRFGAGINGKIGEALSYGLPVVTTSLGANGWGCVDEKQLLVADDADSFAQAVVRVYQSLVLWQTLSDNGYEFIARHHTPEVVGKIIKDSLTN
jgi:GT2 family glycosyltransferase/glycosyltransferase involved in cell wall biosynthesis